MIVFIQFGSLPLSIYFTLNQSNPGFSFCLTNTNYNIFRQSISCECRSSYEGGKVKSLNTWAKFKILKQVFGFFYYPHLIYYIDFGARFILLLLNASFDSWQSIIVSSLEWGLVEPLYMFLYMDTCVGFGI